MLDRRVLGYQSQHHRTDACQTHAAQKLERSELHGGLREADQSGEQRIDRNANDEGVLAPDPIRKHSENDAADHHAVHSGTGNEAEHRVLDARIRLENGEGAAPNSLIITIEQHHQGTKYNDHEEERIEFAFANNLADVYLSHPRSSLHATMQ